MANVKISALPTVTAVGNSDTVPVVQGGVTKQATAAQFLASVLGANPPAALDTLRELADAIGDDPNYATNLALQVAAKAALLAAQATRTTSATLTADTVNPVDATAGAVTVTLPTPTKAGQVITVEKIDATGNPVTISGTIRGTVSTVAIVWQYESVLLIAESLTSWRPVAGHKTKTALDAAYEPKGAVAAQAATDAATYATQPATATSMAATARTAASIFRGMQAAAVRTCNLGNGALSNGTDTSGMYRIAHPVMSAVADVRLVYANWYGAQGSALGDGPNAITVKASLEDPVNAYTATQAAKNYTVTFDNGATTKTIPPGGIAVSDPIPVTAYAGQILYENTYVSVASAGQKWPLGQNTISANLGLSSANYYEGGATGAPTADTTAGGSTPPTGYVPFYGASAVIGSPQAGLASPKSCFAFGDSILYGSHDYTNQWDGWLGRAYTAAGIAYLNVAHPGEQASHVQGTGMKQRLPLATACTTAVVNYGRNDLANIAGITVATFQGYVVFIWRSLAVRGLRVWQTTLTPLTASTDNFITTANQTKAPDAGNNSYNTNRSTFNTWLRDGAPLNPTTFAPAATGTASSATVVRAGAAGHPLTGFIEVADVVETARDSGIWKVGRVVTDAALTAGSRTITSATANWTAADVLQAVYVPGVGHARIASVTSSTVAVYEGGGTAPSTVAGQTVGIGYYCDDGTHPTITGHRAIAATVNAATL